MQFPQKRGGGIFVDLYLFVLLGKTIFKITSKYKSTKILPPAPARIFSISFATLEKFLHSPCSSFIF